MDWISRIFDITKLPSKFFAWVALLTAAHLFLPAPFLIRLQLDKLPIDYKAYSGVAFVAACAFLTINIALWLLARGKSWLLDRKRSAQIAKAVEELDHWEKAILREFFIQGRHVIELPMDHPTIAGLVLKRLLVRASSQGHRSPAGIVFPYALESKTKELLTSDHVNLPENPTPSEIASIRGGRPNFLAEIERYDQGRGSW